MPTHTKIDLAVLDTARDLGRSAFKQGVKRVPAFDRHICALISEHGGSIGSGIAPKLLDAWLQGWDAENLKPESSFPQRTESR